MADWGNGFCTLLVPYACAFSTEIKKRFASNCWVSQKKPLYDYWLFFPVETLVSLSVLFADATGPLGIAALSLTTW